MPATTLKELHAQGGFNDPRLTNRTNSPLMAEVADGDEQVYQAQLVHYYDSPSAPPVPAVAMASGLSQSTRHKLLVVVAPLAGASTGQPTLLKPKLIYVYHRDSARRRETGETSFWDWHPHDLRQAVENLKKELAEIDTMAVLRLTRQVDKLEEANKKLVNEIRTIKARAARAAKKESDDVPTAGESDEATD